MENIIKNAKNAFYKTMNLDDEIKNKALRLIAKKIEEKKDDILFENNKDLKEAQILLDEGKINKPTYERLKLNEAKIRDLIQGLIDLANLENPVNKLVWERELDKGLILKKITTPIGLIGVIFEARPDCYIQISSLIIKSGNCAVLKGGIESKHTNKIFSELVNDVLDNIEGYPKNSINLIYTRDEVKEMLKFDEYIDLIIPRGSNKLVQYIKENTRIPVLGHSSGICHIFVDETALSASSIIIDAKIQYPSACNAVETVLVHKNYKDIQKLKDDLINAGIKIVENPKNYSKEYGDKILTLKVVDDIDCAIEHINKYSSHHTDSILSQNKENIEKFMNLVDSSSVFSNCSTRFSDGFRYGCGAEVGISTNKTHARGPVGLDGLMIYKYKLYGSNNIVLDYVNGTKHFSHKMLH